MTEGGREGVLGDLEGRIAGVEISKGGGGIEVLGSTEAYSRRCMGLEEFKELVESMRGRLGGSFDGEEEIVQ